MQFVGRPNNIITVDTIAQMTAMTKPLARLEIIVNGYSSAGDGGGGEFYWDAASTATANSGTIFASDAGGTGRFIRIVTGTLSPLAFGAYGDATTNDYAALTNIIAWANGAGVGKIDGGGKVYKTLSPLIILDNVTFDLNGGQITSVLSGANDIAVRLRNGSHILNGTIEVQSSGSPSSQAAYHGCIIVGSLYGDGGTVVSPGIDNEISKWSIRNMTLSTNADGKVAIQIMSNANNGTIDDITVPDNAYMFGVVHMDWGTVGSINSADIPTSKINFLAGTAYTTHPHNITVNNIKVGALSRTKTIVDTGSHVIRLSGVYNVTVKNVRAKQCTYAGIKITAGDCGMEFAKSEIKPFRMKDIIVENVALENTTDSWAVWPDSYADNVAAAVGGGYVPLIAPLYETNMRISQVTAVGSGGASVTPGLYLIQINGGSFTDMDMSGYSYGCNVDEQTFNLRIHGIFHGNRGHGIYINHGTYLPEDIQVLRGTQCYQNGQDGGFSNPAGVGIESSKRVTIEGALLGHRTAASETTQSRGIYVISTNASDVRIKNNHVFSVKAAGYAYHLLSSTDYNYIKLFENNTVDSAVTNKYTGVNILPISYTLSTDGFQKTINYATRAVLTADTTPTAGTWVIGDVIYHNNPTGANTGTRCTVAGTPGTWGLF